MNLTILTILVGLLATSGFAEPPATPPVGGAVSSQAASATTADTPWNVVGWWHYTHPAWHDVITFNADGSFSREQGYTGHWRLEVQQDHVVLVLAWKDWEPETVTMYGPDNFRGKLHRDGTDDGEMVLRRIAPPVGAVQPEAAPQRLRHPLSDERFAQIKDFTAYIHTAFDQGIVPRSDVLQADGLLDKARYMHGDISREEWHRLLDDMAGERMRLDVARIRAGAGTIADLLLLQDDVLESSR